MRLVRFRELQVVGICVLILIYLIPIFFFVPFATQDGPMHLYTARVIQSLTDSSSAGEHIEHFFDYRERLHTNVLIQHFFSGLLDYFPALLVEQIFQVLYVLLFSLGAIVCVSAVNKANLFISLLFFPFVFNYLFFMGFYNFVLGIPLLLFALALFFRMFQSSSVGLWSLFWVIILSLLIFLAHMTSFVVLVGVIACVLGCEFLRKLLEKKTDFFQRRTAAVVILVALLLSTSVYGIYEFLHEYGSFRDAYFEPKSLLLTNFLQIESIVSLDLEGERAIARYLLIFYAAILALVLGRRVLVREWFKPTDSLLLASLGVLVAYFLLPLYGIGSGMITTRAMLYPFLLLFLWFAAARFSSFEKIGISGVGVGLALAMFSAQMIAYRKVDPLVQDFLSAKHALLPGDVIYPLIVDGNGYVDGMYLASKVGFFLNITNYLTAIVPNSVNICNAVANEKFSPIKWADAVDMRNIYMQLPGTPPDFQFNEVSNRIGGKLNVILIWGFNDGNIFQVNSRKIENQIPAEFEKTWVSPQGRLALYRKL